MHRAFDLAGIRLHLDAPLHWDLAGLMLLIGRLGTELCRAPDFEIRIGRAETLRPEPDWPTLWQGRLPEGAEAVLREGDGGLELRVDERLALRIETGTRHADMVCRPGGEALVGGTAGVLAVEAALASGGQRLVHGAALRLPSGDDAILLAAPSGAGKTTAAMALSRAGYALFGDDAAVLVPATGGVCLWGLPRAVKLHRRTVAMLPWLDSATGRFGKADERMVPIERLAGAVSLSEAKPAPLAAILLLGPRTDGDSVIRPLSRAGALIALARDNVLCGDDGLEARGRLRFQALAAAAAAAPAFELRVGTDLAALPALVEGAVRDRTVSPPDKTCKQSYF